MAKLKIASSTSVTNVNYPQPAPGDAHVSPTQVNNNYIGGTGGLTSQTGQQIQGQTYVVGASSTTGSILAQKGAHKFRVQDDNGNIGTCKLVDLGTPTAANTMSIGIILANTTVLNASRITNRWVYDFAGNKYRYWTAAATTSNAYAVDKAAGVTGFVQVLDAA